MISFGTSCGYIRVLNDSIWLSGSFDSTYASICNIRNLAGRRKKVTCIVKGESVHWTSSSKLVDTHLLMAFIIMFIFSFIICMSYAMRIAPLSNSDGWSVSSCQSFVFFLVVPSLPISQQVMAIILLFIVPLVMLVVWTSFVPLVQLLLQLLIALGESFDCRDEGLRSSF